MNDFFTFFLFGMLAGICCCCVIMQIFFHKLTKALDELNDIADSCIESARIPDSRHIGASGDTKPTESAKASHGRSKPVKAKDAKFNPGDKIYVKNWEYGAGKILTVEYDNDINQFKYSTLMDNGRDTADFYENELLKA